MSASQITRRFTLDDQHAFARLSGDHNPLHVDPLRARRLLFGGPVVHGVHLTLWALDRLAAAGTGITALARLDLKFDAAALVGDEVVMEPPDLTGGEIRVRLRSGTRTLARFRLSPAASSGPWRNPGPVPAEPCRELAADAIQHERGTVPLGYDVEACAALFPALDCFAPLQIAWLLASTRIIGMRLPGLHSIFVGLQGTFDAAPAEADSIAYHAAAWDDRFHLVTIALAGAGTGRATALLRPAPVDQPAFAEIAARVPPGRFAGASALVIGGSRGLGEAAVKLLAAGGAAVTFTYREGADEAARLAAEISAAGGRATAIRLDVAAPEGALDGRARLPFTHIVYCAAPRIRKGGAAIEAALQARYDDVFVLGLERVLSMIEPYLAPAVTLVVPSTIYIDRPELGFAEYAAAKAAGEEAARAAADRLIAGGRQVRLLQPRFGRLRTDQTAQPGGSDAADPAGALLAVL